MNMLMEYYGTNSGDRVFWYDYVTGECVDTCLAWSEI